MSAERLAARGGACLVTGGTGFIGSYVVRDLLRADVRVTVLDRQPDPRVLRLVAGDDVLDRVRMRAGDAARAAAVFDAVAEARCDTIVHLGAPLPPTTELDAAATVDQMVQAQLNVLDAARILGVRRVVYASASTSVFGPAAAHGGSDVAVANDACHIPQTMYGICKSTNERLADLYWRRHGVDSIGLRITQGYGAGKLRGGAAFAHDMFEAAVRGIGCRIPDVDDLVNWQHADDLAALIVRATRVDTPKTKAFNTTGDVRSMRDSIALLQSIVPGARIETSPGTSAMVMRFDTSACERELGFRCTVGAAEGFRRTVTTLREWVAAGRW